MTEEALRDMSELEEAVDRNGGYWVADPSTIKRSEEEERLFTAFRMYCLEHKIFPSRMTDEEVCELMNNLRKELGIKKKD